MSLTLAILTFVGVAVALAALAAWVLGAAA